MVDESVSQTIRNQKHAEIPHLFVYSQLLLAISGTDGKYGTTKTSDTFWHRWREEEIAEADIARLKNTIPSKAEQKSLFAWREDGPAMQAYFRSLWSGPMLANEQDTLLASLLSTRRLLEVLRYFTLFDKKMGKIVARYPQMFGVKRLIERIQQRKSPNISPWVASGFYWSKLTR